MNEPGGNQSHIVSFIKGSSILVVSNVCLKAINFFLLPLYTGYLTPEMLGISDTITTFTGFLLPLLTMGLDSAYSAFYFDRDDLNRGNKVFCTLGFAFFVLGVVPFSGFLFSEQISDVLFRTREYSLIIRLALASVSLNLWYLPYSLELRLQNKMALFGLSNILASLLMIMFNVLFVSCFQLGALSLVLSTAIVHGILLAVLILFVKKTPNREYYDRALMKEMLCFSAPLIPMTVMNWILTLSDRAVILKSWGNDYVGLYGISTRFITLLNVVISGITMAYTTFAFSSKEQENAKEHYYYLFNVLSYMLVVIAFTASLFGSEIVHLMTAPSYADAYRPLRDLMFAQAVYGMTTIVGYGIFFEKKSKYSLYATSAAALANLVLNLILIPRLGYAVAATTTLIGYLIQFAVTYNASVYFYPCDYGMPKMLAATGILYIVCIAFQRSSILLKLIVWSISVVFLIHFYWELIRKVVLFSTALLRRR